MATRKNTQSVERWCEALPSQSALKRKRKLGSRIDPPVSAELRQTKNVD
jgi:hypothetical protein